jgi:hypothetical protein
MPMLSSIICLEEVTMFGQITAMETTIIALIGVQKVLLGPLHILLITGCMRNLKIPTLFPVWSILVPLIPQLTFTVNDHLIPGPILSSSTMDG